MENYVIMARRYRPITFDEVIGQDHIIKTLKNSLTTGRIAQAYLFTGSRGIGKTTVARILAKAIECEKGIKSNPCGKCKTCIAIAQSRFPDVVEIDGASNRGVDDIRAIRENLLYTPTAKERIYIIDEVHMLTKEAFNALLKTLEEPPGRTRFIFATTEPEKIPQTILSRCQRFDFRLLSENQLIKYLSKLAELDKINISDEALEIISRRASGSVRDAISLLDQLSVYSENKIDSAIASEILGEIDSNTNYELLFSIAKHDLKATLDKVESIFSNGYQPIEIIRGLSELLYEILKNYNSAGKYSELSKLIGIDRIIRFLKILSELTERHIQISPKIQLEVNLAKMTRMVDTTSIKDILFNLEKGDINKSAEVFEQKVDITTTNTEVISKWDQFLAKVNKKDKILSKYLTNAKIETATEKMIKVKLSNPGYLKLLTNTKNKDKLEQIAFEIWGNDIKLSYTSAQNNDKKHLRQFENDEGVIKIKEIFDADIIDAK